MSTTATQSVALAGDWLNTSNTGGELTWASNTVGLTFCGNAWPYQWYYVPYVQTYGIPARPIRLTMREVEKLRTAAQKDKKLKDVLAKFTDQIEVIVDFESEEK